MEVIDNVVSDGSMVGNNPGANVNAGQCGTDGLVAPGETITYTLYTPHEGTFVVNSYGATIGSEASSGNLGIGMFGQLNVQPKGARMYRSQVTEEELRLAINNAVDLGQADCGSGNDPAPGFTCFGQPVINYDAVYPGTPGDGSVWALEGKAGLPILKMLTATNELVHSDINAIIAGPDADGTWKSVCASGSADCPYPLERVGKNNPQLPNRLEPFREYSYIFHDEQTNS